jgi:hypothetical protein
LPEGHAKSMNFSEAKSQLNPVHQQKPSSFIIKGKLNHVILPA